MITWIKNLFAKASRITELEAMVASRDNKYEYCQAYFDGMCDGEDAHEAGQSLTDNPHEEGYVMWDAWRTGWIEEEYMKLNEMKKED